MKKKILLVFLLIGLQFSVYGQENVKIEISQPDMNQLSSGNNLAALADDLKIGGRNYVKNSAFLDNYSGWYISGKCFTETKDGMNTLGFNRVGYYTVDGYVRSPQMDNLMIDEFTLSFLVYSLNGFVYVDFDGDYDNSMYTFVPARSWQKVSFHVKANKIIKSFNFCLFGTDSNVMDGWATRFKLEYGNQVTDWSPAPEDVNQKFSDVGINTANKSMSLNKLDVNGTIRAKEIRVETGWADFVFKKDYKLPTLNDIEKFVNENGHLPNIPTEKEVKENGISLGEMNAKLLQKVEEMTLHLIQQNKEIESLKNKIRDMELKK